MIRTIVIFGLLFVTACGEVKPGTPGHEPPDSGNINPVTGTRSTGH